MRNNETGKLNMVSPKGKMPADKKEKAGDFSEGKNAPITETENSVTYLGVELPKGKGGEFCPKKENYGHYINDEFSLELQKKIATAFKLDQAILIEGGTSIGKTTTVKKMCADLGWEVYYKNLNGATDVEDMMGRYIPNPERKTANEPEYKWADGPVTQGLRKEDEKIKVIILDEYNSANPNIVIRLHEVLDELEKNGEVVLAEDASERVKVDKSKTKIIALTNPPGKGYLDRQPLDPAQLRRWVYQKEVTELPKETFSGSVDMMFHLKPEVKEFNLEKFLNSNENEIPIGELREIPGMTEMVEKYKEFHQATKELLKNRSIAQDQPQAFMYDDRMEPQRVLKFIQNFYRGDINAVWKEALKYFYVNKLEDKTDRQKLFELINAIEYAQPVESKRKGVDREKKSKPKESPEKTPEELEKEKTLAEIEKVRKRIEGSPKVPDGFLEEKREELSGELSEQIKIAKEIFGEKDVLGVEEIEKAFSIKVGRKDVPKIPFSKEDLEKAKELGQFLILRVNKDRSGNPLTMARTKEMLSDEFTREKKGKITMSDSYSKEFWEDDPIAMRWALVSKEVIPDSTSKNYFEQTEEVVKYIRKEKLISPEYQEAIEEFEDYAKFKFSGKTKEEISKLLGGSSWEKYAQELSELKINKISRHTPAEFLYDILAYFQKNGERLYENMYIWTSRRDSSGKLVYVGYFDSDGVSVNSDQPDYSYDDLGVAFSCSL